MMKNFSISMSDIDESKIDSNIKAKVDILKKEIINLSTYKEYQYLKKCIFESKSLQKLFDIQKFLHKCDITKAEKEQYDEAKRIINSSPLVANYKTVENELRYTLLEIKEILEK